MIVTDKEISMEKKLVAMLDLMINRMTGSRKMDNVLIIDGDEGYGKSTLSSQVGYYVHHKTGRPFTVDNFYFDIDKMTDFATNTKEQIIIWDEAALAGLASEWYRKEQIKLIKLLMVSRKKRHFWIFNIPKFFKMNEYVVIDRAIGLIHVYARNEQQLGRFVYFRKSRKGKLYDKWRKSHIRAYNKLRSFRGTFSSKFGELIDEEEYDKKKDEAILGVGKEKVNKAEVKKKELEGKVALLVKKYKIPVTEACADLGICRKTYYNHLNKLNSLEKSPV